MYYLAPADRAYSAYEIKRKTGLDPELAGIVALNFAGVYPVVDVANPHDTRLYDVALSYTINGTNADQTWTKTDKDLAETKTVAIAIMKAEVEAAAIAAANGFPVLALAASASKTASSRDATVQAALDGVNAVLTQLVADIVTINAAADVDAIDAVVNP